jgi:hypothetical protein
VTPRREAISRTHHSGEELGRLDVVERENRLLREQLDPAAAGQGQQPVALGLEPLLEQRGQLLEHVLAFGVRLTQERHAEHREGIEGNISGVES